MLHELNERNRTYISAVSIVEFGLNKSNFDLNLFDMINMN